jgi:predicted S18 family serine protease
MAGKTTLAENLIFIIILGVVLAVTIGPVIWNHFRKSAVLSSGIETTARIIDVTDTGRRHNTNPVVKIRLVVKAANGDEYNAEITSPVSPVKLPEYKAGATVNVKYDPKKRENVAIINAGAKGQ